MVCFPESAKCWDYSLNNITPDKVSPASQSKYWFICQNNKCNMSYLQSLDYRTVLYGNSKGCPYCASSKVTEHNSLLFNFPNLCKELSENNTISPSEITAMSSVKLIWTCNKHDELFLWKARVANRTANDAGCPKCNVKGYDQIVGGHDHYVKISNEVHENKYEYPGKYINKNIPIEIFCPEKDLAGNTHGIFKQRPDSHKRGQGCKKCYLQQTQSKGITKIEKVLFELGYITGKDVFKEQKLKGLQYKSPLRLDICIPVENLVIEYDGSQHFKMSKRWGGEENLKICQTRDKIKDKFCIINGINLVRIPYTTKITTDLLRNIIHMCRHKKHILISYPDYIKQNMEFILKSGIYHIEISI